jgi:hypothetical protein
MFEKFDDYYNEDELSNDNSYYLSDEEDWIDFFDYQNDDGPSELNF